MNSQRPQGEACASKRQGLSTLQSPGQEPASSHPAVAEFPRARESLLSQTVRATSHSSQKRQSVTQA